MPTFVATVEIEVPDSEHFCEALFRRVIAAELRAAVEDRHRGTVPSVLIARNNPGRGA
jgi:hypothetical protein